MTEQEAREEARRTGGKAYYDRFSLGWYVLPGEMQASLERQLKAEGPGEAPTYEVVKAVDVEGISPVWATGIVDPWTHFAMQAYREDGYTPEQLSLRGRQIGYVNEQGEPTDAWLRTYELGIMPLEPRPLPPIDAGMVGSGVPWRRLTDTERERADILPYFMPIASLGETGTRISEGKLLEDITGTIKWLLLAAAIGGVIWLAWSVAKEK